MATPDVGTADYSVTGPKILRRGRGQSKQSIALVEAAHAFLQVAQPTTVRGICYKLFVDGIISSMSRKDTARVSRLLTVAREHDLIPWEWIVDETRELERSSTWRGPAAFVRTVRRSYRRDFWVEQPERVEVWSEKGTIRGVVQPVLDEFGVGFRVMHGFGSATAVYEAASEPLTALYVGDWDPSGLYMSSVDLPGRLQRYGGEDVVVERIALLADDTHWLPWFAASTKAGDSRYRWFVENHGDQCWELDAMHPNDLRSRVQEAISDRIDWPAWQRCERAQDAEQESLEHLLDKWTAA